MKFEDNLFRLNGQMSKKELYKNTSLKKARTTSYNNQILRRLTTTRIDMEKANYNSELVWENERTSEEDEEVFKRKSVSIIQFFCTLFEPIDWVFFTLGIIGCLAAGISTPLIYYLNSEIYTNVGNTSEKSGSISEEELMKENVKHSMNSNIKKQFIYGFIALVDNFIAYFFIGLICMRSLYNFKKKYFSTIFSQEQGWFDSTNVFIFASKIQSQIEIIETGVGDPLVDDVVKICIVLGCLVFSFFGSWKLTLVILCLSPLMSITGVFTSRVKYKGSVLSNDVYSQTGSIAEEILYNIKIISSFANFDYELKRFYEKTELTANLEKKTNFSSGFFLSLLYLA